MITNYTRFVMCLFLLSSHILFGQSDEVSMFIFGHSLIDHRPPAIPTPSDETTVAHWVFNIAQQAGHTFAAGGQYGFLPQHANLPPFSQWGYDLVPGVWDSDIESFGETDISHIMITAGNFIQGLPPTMPYYGPDSIHTPISATIDIVDWVNVQKDSLKIYIYENWPEMSDSILPFPPTPTQLAPYHDYTQEEFHDWWIEYQDSLIDQRANAQVRMLPVGSIISKLLTTTLSSIPVHEIYEDTAPHGRATLYFLASLVTYMGVYVEPAPMDLSIDTIVHEDVVNNYAQIVNFIWNELINFNDANGNSRVFFENLASVNVELDSSSINLYPNPTAGEFVIDGLTEGYNIDVLDVNGVLYQNYNSSSQVIIDISSLPAALYFIRIQKAGSNTLFLEKILKE